MNHEPILEIASPSPVNIDRMAALGEQFCIKLFSVVDKFSEPKAFNAVKHIEERLPDAKKILHFSCALHDTEQLHDIIKYFSLDPSKYELLVVSGDDKNPNFETLHALDFIKETNPQFGVGVVFDHEAKNSDEELERLQKKLSHEFVNHVIFQISFDIDSIIRGIEAVRAVNPHCKISVPILILTEKTIEILKQRPWKGVTIPEQFMEYDSEVSYLEIFKILEDYDVSWHIEGIGIGEKEMSVLERVLLRSRVGV